MNAVTTAHYDAQYFLWQAPIGEFGGWANQTKFLKYLKPDCDVLDFGCGGGYLLKGLPCRRRLGIEINPQAAEVARSNGVETFSGPHEVPDDSCDVIISNNALEHVTDPLTELRNLYPKLRRGGKIVFVVPCESIRHRYRSDDVNHHLFSWSPMCLGNLMGDAGFKILDVHAYVHKWPPGYRSIARFGGRAGFELACRIYGHLERSWFQVRGVGTKE